MDRSTRARVARGFAFPLDALPLDVLELLMSFLSGFDVLPLSHVNRRFFSVLLAPDADEWKRRAAISTPETAKESYLRSRSFQFPGLEVNAPVERHRGACCELAQEVTQAWGASSFSFDLWFALLPSAASPKNYEGGILFGAQSVHYSSNWWADYHQQFVIVNADLELGCSVLNDRPFITPKLELQRWYHVALTYDRPSSDPGVQRVYVDGKLVHTSEGYPHHEWGHLYYKQLGAGCVTGCGPPPPGDIFVGWFCFNGVIDTFRCWSGVLSDENVERLAQDTHEGSLADGPQLHWSLQRDEHRKFGPVQRVKCLRPRERVCVIENGKESSG